MVRVRGVRRRVWGFLVQMLERRGNAAWVSPVFWWPGGTLKTFGYQPGQVRTMEEPVSYRPVDNGAVVLNAT